LTDWQLQNAKSSPMNK